MTGILSKLAELAGTAMTLLGDVVSAVTSSDILLLFTILGLVGIGVGFFKRLTN